MKVKLNIPRLTAAESQAGFEERRKWLLQKLTGPDLSSDLYGKNAIANLLENIWLSESNERLRFVTEWFDHPHPHGRDHRGECDFAALKLSLAYYLFQKEGSLEQSTRQQIRAFFLKQDIFSKHPSENHVLIARTSRYLMGHVYRNERFEAYGLIGSELVRADEEWLLAYLRFRARRGWGEFDSSSYIGAEWECLSMLQAFSPEASLSHMAGMMMDALLADMAVDSWAGLYGGAHGRIYQQQAHDHLEAPAYWLQFLYFGNVDRGAGRVGHLVVEALIGDFRPHPVVLGIALERTEPYENRERKHLHNCADPLPERPLEGSICKYTYWTPEYMLGAVQRQDPYPQECEESWYARHEQHEWDLTISTRTAARIFTHHPGGDGREHGYWTGDIRCCCGHFLQHRNVVLAVYDIPEREPYDFIHAYAPIDAFDECVEENGFVFFREGCVYAALKMLGGHEFVHDGPWKAQEIISRGRRNGVVCEVGLSGHYDSFDDFRQQVAENVLNFDSVNMTLSYKSKHAGKLTLDTVGTRLIDDRQVDLNYSTYDSPYMKSDWDSGVIVIGSVKAERLKLDFLQNKREELDG